MTSAAASFSVRLVGIQTGEAGGCRTEAVTEYGNREPRSAGHVSIAGTETVSLDPPNYNVSFPGSLFAPDELLGLEVEGAEVPSFSASLRAPSHFVLTSPTDLASIPTGNLALAWDPSPTDVVFSVYQSSPGYHASSFSISCTFRGLDGAATVPASVFEALHPGPKSAVVEAANVERLSVDGWDIEIVARGNAKAWNFP